eukprot:4568762-Prymnesium_polylepis.2
MCCAGSLRERAVGAAQRLGRGCGRRGTQLAAASTEVMRCLGRALRSGGAYTCVFGRRKRGVRVAAGGAE